MEDLKQEQVMRQGDLLQVEEIEPVVEAEKSCQVAMHRLAPADCSELGLELGFVEDLGVVLVPLPVPVVGHNDSL